MPEMRSAIVAGSKGFVDAVQGHIKMRFGEAPRVARDPAEALRACADGGGLLVLEYAGAPWLDAVKNLRGARGDAMLSIVAAVPAAQASDVQPLQRAGVDEVVSWQGRVDPVLWAVDRVVGRQTRNQNEAALSASEDVETIENGFEAGEIPAGAPAAAVPVAPTLPRAAPSVAEPAPELPWPDGVPSVAAAEALLLSVAAGQPAGDAGQRAAAERLLGAASELERAAFAGIEIPLDPPLLRGALATRLRLEVALSTVPSDAARVNQPAAQQLVADVDVALGQLKALTAAAPAGVAPSLEPIRLALVDVGVKLAGIVTGLAQAPAARPATPASPARAGAARVLSNEQDVTVERRRSPLALWIVLGLAVVIGAAYHGRSLLHPPPAPRASIPGAPANTMGMVRGGVAVFKTLPGATIDPAELERFKVAEKAKGNVVEEVAPGTYKVLPVNAKSPEPTRGGP